MSESAIQRGAINLLIMHGWLVIRVNSGGQQAEYTTKSGQKKSRWFWFSKWFCSGHDEESAGVSDLIVTSPAGETVYIETKTPGKEPTPKQREFGAEVLARNARWIVCDDLAIIQELVEDYLNQSARLP